jgi:hypothetical protein
VSSPAGILERHRSGGRRTSAAARPAGLEQDQPWTRADARRSGAWCVLGLVALIICAVGASFSKTYNRELVWTGFALVSLAAAVLGGVSWVLSGTRAVRLARRDVMQSLAALTARAPASEAAAGSDVFFTSSMSRYHVGTCPFARGKELVAAGRDDAGRAGLRPCEVCTP